jgi:hypothetical protein
MHTGQNFIAPANSVPQAGQVRLSSIFMDLTVLRMRPYGSDPGEIDDEIHALCTSSMRAERFQFRQGTKEQSSYAGRRRLTLTAKLRSKIEPEQSLAKLSMDATSNFSFRFARATVPLMFESSLFIQPDGSIMMR